MAESGDYEEQILPSRESFQYFSGHRKVTETLCIRTWVKLTHSSENLPPLSIFFTNKEVGFTFKLLELGEQESIPGENDLGRAYFSWKELATIRQWNKLVKSIPEKEHVHGRCDAEQKDLQQGGKGLFAKELTNIASVTDNSKCPLLNLRLHATQGHRSSHTMYVSIPDHGPLK